MPFRISWLILDHYNDLYKAAFPSPRLFILHLEVLEVNFLHVVTRENKEQLKPEIQGLRDGYMNITTPVHSLVPTYKIQARQHMTITPVLVKQVDLQDLLAVQSSQNRFRDPVSKIIWRVFEKHPQHGVHMLVHLHVCTYLHIHTYTCTH